MIEGHGDDGYRYGDLVKYNFSTNIVSRHEHKGLGEFLYNQFYKVGGYPEPAPYSLERMIAGELGIKPENVVVTNGATDAIYRIAFIFKEGRSCIFIPTFREYQDACRLHNQDIEFVESLSEISYDSDSVWICNPNNPTGIVTPKDELLGVAARLGKGWMIVDQAYASYTSLPVITPREAAEAGNIVLLSSLTKRFSVPGLRIGYAVGSEAVCRSIRDSGMPWCVSVPAIEGAKYLLIHKDDYKIDAVSLHKEAERISEAFESMGIECSKTDCNFILCRLPQGSVSELKYYLVKNVGILIRDASNFEGLDRRYFRVAAQSRMENDLLISAVKKWMR